MIYCQEWSQKVAPTVHRIKGAVTLFLCVLFWNESDVFLNDFALCI